MFKKYIKPDKKKSFLTLFIIVIACGSLYLSFILGIFIPEELEILKIIGLPLQIAFIFDSGVLIYILLPVTIFWIYLLACILLYLETKIIKINWNTKKIIALGVVFILCFVVYNFNNLGMSDTFITTADDSGVTTLGINAVTKANNQFAIDLYNEINIDNSNKNIFFSPWSISTAVAMVYEGARGNTSKEIEKVFYFPENDSSRRSSYANILNTINKARGKYKLHIANAIWLQKDYFFLKSYKDIISKYYLGEIKNLDFDKNPNDSSFKINNWVSKNTNNKIKKIVSPDMFSSSTRAILTNAIYFKGKWKHQFDKTHTKFEDFTVGSGQKIKVPMMKLIDNNLNFNYAESDGIQILEMPYQGDKISMLVLLPKIKMSNRIYNKDEIQSQSINISQLQSILSPVKLHKWINKMKPESVHIYIPKFTFKTSYSLNDHLKNLNLSLPFSSRADFSGMDGTQMLYINKILHKAYIDVSEEGTEAAAATSVSVDSLSVNYIREFKANHPFIFLILEKKTGNILFMGKVNNPT